MVQQESQPVEERVVELLRHLGIGKAHVAAYLPGDWSGLLERHPSAVASLTLICPRGMKIELLRPHRDRMMVVTGDGGNEVAELMGAMDKLPGAALTVLRDYYSPMWADVMAERGDAALPALLKFLARMEGASAASPVRLPEGEGEAAGISYTVRGSGPPLLLFPLALAASQWEPVLAALAERFTTITVGGAHLGMVAFLESRAEGYLRVVRGAVAEVALEPGQRVLEVGCGAGTVARWLARHTAKRNPIVGADINAYLLREAARLAAAEGVDDVIELHNANGQALPFPDGGFDATLAFTVMEEGDADAMLAECVRVTRPGGRVAVIVRSLDMPWWVNLPLRSDLKLKAQTGYGDMVEGGCADASLYERMERAGLEGVVMMPQWATYSSGERLHQQQERMVSRLDPAEAEEWRQAIVAAGNQFFISQPFHSGVGTKR
ncbi:MAG: methyltransferase domain-containing protein [Deltaproteobacteria bacterium]|nr:methyltransferase domain-containing protein [Deltaproteobacteria bacterium]